MLFQLFIIIIIILKGDFFFYSVKVLPCVYKRVQESYVLIICCGNYLCMLMNFTKKKC